MACESRIERIQELIDGTLGAIRRSALEQHLEQGPSGAARRKRDLGGSRGAPAALPALPAPDGAWLQIAGRLRQEGRLREAAPAAASRQRSYAWLAIAATLVLALGLPAVVLFRSSPAPAPSGATAASGARGAPGNTNTSQPGDHVQNHVAAAQQKFEAASVKKNDLRKTNMNALAPQTSAVIEKNLGIIDNAIE